MPDDAEKTGAFSPGPAAEGGTQQESASRIERKSKPQPQSFSRDLHGATIAGRYKLLQRLGEGGMGEVWMAEQREPVKRQVAVKLIKPGMASEAMMRRFEAERQALALMDHPNIAKVLDGGTDEHDQPFFVMELVKGMPITKFCDQEKLSFEDRLKLFITVCHAVQYAHQKGIIHRDLKPSNILIALYDGVPVPKIIDFGVAKATAQKLTDKTLFTEIGQIIGTLEYMAPEQAELNNLDIDTRADVYSLGRLLYEMLAGSTPFTSAELRNAGVAAMLQKIREVDPPKPSTRLSGSESLPSIAATRKLEPARLVKTVSGELDWIVMKSLAKERQRRYDTPNELAADLERYLHHEPVKAGPESRTYRIRKFVKRNRAGVIAASLVFLALTAGIIATTLGLLEAKRQEGIAKAETAAKETALQAETAAKELATTETAAKVEALKKEQTALATAEKRLDAAKKSNEILGDVFAGLDPKANYETVAELRDALKKNVLDAAKKLEGSSIGDPLTVADMQKELGCSLLGLGEAQAAIELLTKCRTVRTQLLGPDHLRTFASMNNLAEGYRMNGQLDKALPLYEETLKLVKVKLGPDHPDTLTSMFNLAAAYLAASQLDKALPLFEETLKLRKAKLEPDHPDTLASMSGVAAAYLAAGQLDKALPLYEETLKLQKAKLGPDHPDTLRSMSGLAEGYRAAGQLGKALPLFDQTLKLQKAKLGPDHPRTLASMSGLAQGYRAAGQLEKALPLYEEELKLRKAKLGPNHQETLSNMSDLAECYGAAGHMDKALPLIEETLKLQKAKLGPDHPDTLTSMGNLAAAYLAAGQLDKALPLCEETLKLEEAKLGHDHPRTITSMNNLAVGYLNAGQLAKALPLCEEALMLRKAKLGPDHPDTLQSMNNLALAYRDARQGVKAAAVFREYIAAQRKKFPQDDPRFSGQLALVSSNLLKCGQFAAAEGYLRECLVIREKTEPDAWTTFNTDSMLGEALLGQKKYADAESLLVKGYEGLKAREKNPGADAARLALQQRIPEALDRLIKLYQATKQPDEAKKYGELRSQYPKELAPPPRKAA